MNDVITKILTFLEEIGLEYQLGNIEGNTFLPGLKLRNGSLVIDREKLRYPGDILHEAGHLATMPPEIRKTMDDNLEGNDLHQGGELMAIAWSYAACVFLKIDPHVVFHEDGYKGGGSHIVENFSKGNYFGVPLLQWCGMTYDQKTGAENGQKSFPSMIRWTCLSRPQ